MAYQQPPPAQGYQQPPPDQAPYYPQGQPQYDQQQQGGYPPQQQQQTNNVVIMQQPQAQQVHERVKYGIYAALLLTGIWLLLSQKAILLFFV